MRMVHSLVVVACVALALAFSANSAKANTYASDVRVTFSGNFNTGPAQVNFVLNDSAVTVVVRIKQGATVVRTINAGAKRRGENTVNWDGKNDAGGNAPAGTYSVEIETTGQNYSKWTNIFISPHNGIFTRGGDIIRNQSSQRFGHNLAGDVGGGTDDSVTPSVAVAKSLREWRADGSNAATPNQVLLLTPVLGAANQPWFVTTDDDGNIYFSSIQSGAIYRLRDDLTGLRIIIAGVGHPRGIDVVGTGADRTIYFASDTTVFRFKIGNADTFATRPDVVLQRSAYVRDVILDESGLMYISTRPYTTSFLDGGSTGTVEKYNISGALPKTKSDTSWSKLFNVPPAVRPAGLAMDYGDNRTSNTDDKLFSSFSDTVGIYQFDLTTGAPTRIIGKPPVGSGSANQRADLSVDPAGNIVWWENNAEYLLMYAPPGAKAYTTAAISPINVSTPLPVESIRADIAIVREFALHQNYPNPFNPSTQIAYELASQRHVSLKIFNTMGQVVKTLVDGEQPAGRYTITWDGTSEAGTRVTSGVYLYVIKAGDFVQSRRLTVLK